MARQDETEKRKYKEGGKNEELLTSEEAARYLKVEKGALAIWRSTKRYEVPYIRVGRLVRYRASDLKKFLDKYYNDLKKE